PASCRPQGQRRSEGNRAFRPPRLGPLLALSPRLIFSQVQPIGQGRYPPPVACLETMLSRRQLLAASPTTLPLFLVLSGCKGPAVLGAPPVVSQQTQVLLHAVTAEQGLIWIYGKVMSVYPALAAALSPLRAEHEAHL